MRFYSNDHPPAHVHCINGDGTVVVRIATAEVVAIKGGINKRDVARAEQLVREHCGMLLVEWNLFDMRRREIR